VSSVARTSGSSPVPSGLGLLAVAEPLTVVGLAFVLWQMSDRLLYIGPLDRATFGWVVVIPIWAMAPLAAGFAWRHLSPRATRLAAATCALILGGLGAAFFWQAVAFPGCEYGPVRGASGWVLPGLALGAVLGGGFALAGLAACTSVRASRPWRALAVGVVGQVGLLVLAIILTFGLSIGAACQRPPV
jgi:hypothetical protein